MDHLTANQPVISCLLVTQPGRFESFATACDQFRRQTWRNRELVVVCDGPASYNERLKAHCKTLAIEARYVFCDEQTLGALRNESVAAAGGEIICQWDDDDQYHPKRLELQVSELLGADADFCYLTDQLHYFADTGELYWLDWLRNAAGIPHPDSPHLQAVPGSLMARKDRMIAYTTDPRGEDTLLLLYATIAKRKIHLASRLGWTHLYIFHGANTWGRSHHEMLLNERSRPLNHEEMEAFAKHARQHYDERFNIEEVLGAYRFEGTAPGIKTVG